MAKEPYEILFTRIEPRKPIETVWPLLPDISFKPPADPGEAYLLWLNAPFISDDMKKQARALTGASGAEEAEEALAQATGNTLAEIQDSFSSLLEFGTAGLRGIMGPGFNRMNTWTVGTTIQALADVLKDAYNSRERKKRYVAIGYDTRHGSEEFAWLAAGILAANDLQVRIFDNYVPTPILAYATHRQECLAGIMVTASHNPRQYSGIKFYEDGGIQMGEGLAEAVSLRRGDSYITVPQSDLREHDGVDLMPSSAEGNYLNFLINHLPPRGYEDDLKIVYTPVHGTGARFVMPLLEELGFTDLVPVTEQMEPDPDFPTTPSPNPEQEPAMALAREYAEANNADIVLATDPDADRLAVMVQDSLGEWKLLTGNQIGGLLTYYYINYLKENNRLPEDPTLVISVVTDKFGAAIAENLNVEVVESLTGFKNICGKIREFRSRGGNNYIMGYEESIGYALGQEVLDKDGISALALFASAAAKEKSDGSSVWERLVSLQEQYGYFVSLPVQHSIEGQDGQALKDEIMKTFRHAKGADLPFDPADEGEGKDLPYLLRKDDYLQRRSFTYERHGSTLVVNSTQIEELSSDVLRFIFSDGSWFAIRPSGTEPKLKFYYYGHHEDESIARHQAERLARMAERILESLSSADQDEDPVG